jgi:hypothetical protein
VFADNGAGIRGDMKSVVRAILTDSEARDETWISDTSGKVRDPVQRLTNWARAFKATSVSGAWDIRDLSDPVTGLGQSPGRSPSVFNFFRPGYSPPNTRINELGLVAPELQITTEQSVIGYANFMFRTVSSGIADVQPDYADLLRLASNSRRLMDEINLVLAAGQLGSSTMGTIRAAVDDIPRRNSGEQRRVWTAVLLTLVSPDYLVLH